MSTKDKEPQIDYYLGTTSVNAIYNNTIVIDSLKDYLINEGNIKASIDLFNREIEWDAMWDFEQGKSRIQKPNYKLFLLEVDSEVKGHAWFHNGYLHNMFISKTRPDNISVKFLQGTFNFIPEAWIGLRVDEWNKRAQRYFEKVGFQRNNS